MTDPTGPQDADQPEAEAADAPAAELPVTAQAAPTSGPATTPQPAGWYPSGDGMLAYWDGAAWTGATAPAAGSAADEKATYGEKFRRRLPIVLAVAGLVWLVNAAVIGNLPENYAAVVGSNGKVIMPILIIVGIVLGTLFWTAIVALFPGRKKTTRRSWLLAVGAVAGIAAAVIAAMAFGKTPELPTTSIASPPEGCQAFLDTFETIADKQLNNAAAATYLQALAEQARANDPELAADLAPLDATATEADYTTATQSVITRCVSNGYLTEQQVQDWATTLQSSGG